jgi:hypothetical protein
MQKRAFYPGERAEISGQYGLFDEEGHNTGLEATVVKGEPLPPTPKPNMTYKLTDPTKHKQSH